MRKKHHHMILYLLILFLFSSYAFADTLVELKEFYMEEIRFAGFSTTQEQTVEIELMAIMPKHYSSRSSLSFAWILNSNTREVIWDMNDAGIDDRDGIRVMLKDELNLEPGTYEVYYSTYPRYYQSDDWFRSSSQGFFSYLFGNERHYFFEDEFEQMYIRVVGNGTALSESEIREKQESLKSESFLTFTNLRDEMYNEQILRVDKPVNLRVYALGEARRDGEFDFGWIVNLKTRERVWQLTYRHSEYGGGAQKNRMYNDLVTLEPGLYRIMFVTDDSHSYRRWNMAPPYDPEFWGITIWLESPAEEQNLAKLDGTDQLGVSPLVEFSKVRDREYLSQGFVLKEPMDIQIFALGEGQDGDMYDYAWIIDLASRKTVWKMDYYETDCAGGDEKNRMFDGIVSLEAGKYMVHYVTDGSHAYHSWNTGAPFDEKKWGITISVPEDKLASGLVVEYDEASDEKLLVKMTKMGDTDRRRAKFSVEKDQYVNIYALGEGDEGHMYDYAWIENANTGKVVWEMTYRKTRRAGGAHKNRLFNEDVLLPAGEYYVIYETDGSHSFDDWNDSPPYDPGSWGITITLANGD
jgi:hypothetical protein